MKKFITNAILVSFISTMGFANSTQVFVSKTGTEKKIGTVENMFAGTTKEFAIESEALFDKESLYVEDKKIDTGYSTAQVAAQGAFAGAGMVAAQAAARGSLAGAGSSMRSSGGLIGLALIGATVATVAVVNGTQGMRDDNTYLSLYRNTVDNKVNLIYVYIISNGELKKEEIEKIASEKIKGL